MRFVQNLLISSVALGSTMAAFAQQLSKNTNVLPPGYRQCPKISDIHKNPKTRTWGNRNGWKSYETSFANHIASFLGAQWRGIKIGNVACLYKPKEGLTFPIILHFSRLTYEPVGKHWGRNLGGYMNCKSYQIKDCIFKPETKSKSANIYEEASLLKGQHLQQQGF